MPLAGIVPPESDREVEPAIGLKVAPHVLLDDGMAATSIPEGSRSVKATEVIGVEFRLVSVKPSVDASPA